MVEGRLKDAQEEVDKEKALKQVAEASLKEKTLGLNIMERRATTTKKVLELIEQKASEAAGKLGETELSLQRLLASSPPGTKNSLTTRVGKRHESKLTTTRVLGMLKT